MKIHLLYPIERTVCFRQDPEVSLIDVGPRLEVVATSPRGCHGYMKGMATLPRGGRHQTLLVLHSFALYSSW